MNLKWLRKLSVSSKLAIIIGLIFFILFLGLLNFWFSLKVMSSVRSYVAGEGIWSKAQKNAVNSLLKYSTTFEQKDYDNYLKAIQIPLGDKVSRLEMNKEHPDYDLNRRALIQGGNHPDDVEDLVFLYRNFRWVSFVSIAVKDWEAGDAEFEKLMVVGERMHEIISARSEMDDPALHEDRVEELSQLIIELYAIDERLTELELHFSATLGEGSRTIRDLLLLVTSVVTVLFGTLILYVVSYISAHIVEVDKKKNEFVFLVSHQLKTPMTLISWYTELLLKKGIKDDEKQKKYVQEIHSTNKRMIDLVNALLNVSRIEMGTFMVNPSKSSLSVSVDEVIDMFKVHFSLKKITLRKNYQEDLPLIALDPQIIRIAVSNLLSNAIKYSYDKGRITVSLFQKDGCIHIKIDDEGIGIPKSQQGRLFEKFFRSDNARKMNTDGSGLGLFIVESIIRNAGGKVTFTSEENKGSSFIISFPLEGMRRKEGTKQLT